MSRNHAEIFLNNHKKVIYCLLLCEFICLLSNQIITIQDIGSMHGTFVNDLQLRAHEPKELSKNDVVVFGAEVKRNADTFPACVFRVDLELLPFKYVTCRQMEGCETETNNSDYGPRQNSSYAFPESDEEDYEISDDEGNEEPSSEDGVSIESTAHKASETTTAIDLTRDDSPADSDVECTGEAAVEKQNTVNVLAGRSTDINHNADPVSIALCAADPPILVDTDDEDANFSSDSDDQSEIEYGDDAASVAADSIDEEGEQDSDDDNSVHSMDDEGAAASEPRDSAENALEQASSLASLGFRTFSNQPSAEPDIGATIDATESMVDEEIQDDGSDFGLSDAGAEGIRALFDDGLIDNGVNSYYNLNCESESNNVVDHDVPAEDTMIDDPLATPKRVTFAEPSPEPNSSCLQFAAYGGALNAFAADQGALNVRQPSPSDAAMVKTATPSNVLLNDSANHITVQHLPSQEFQKLTAQSLGDKSGKHAFFAAREDNRAKIYRGDEVIHRASAEENRKSPEERAVELKQCSRFAQRKFRERKRPMLGEAESKLSEASKSSRVTLPAIRAVSPSKPPKFKEHGAMLNLPVINSFSGPSYLDDHTQTLKDLPSPAPEPDMKSAVTHNQSKASMVAASQHVNTSGRSGLSIKDIIDGTDDPLPKTLKRKSDDISEAIENEVRAWASSTSAMNDLEGSKAMLAPVLLQCATREDQSESSVATEQRPAKRLRKIVESVGYVALGGATLFGALVLSAPDFL